MPQARELILTGGNIITLDPARPSASAMIVRDGKIAFVGTDEEALARSSRGGRTSVGLLSGLEHVSLAGKTILPGFIDAHIHLYAYGLHLLRVADLTASVSIDDLLARLGEIASRTEGWIQGFGFEQDKLRERRFPTRDDLDRVSRDRPIIASRVCGHAAVVNSAALALVTEEERRAGDERRGLYTERAIAPFFRRIPPLDESEAEQAVLAAADVALRSGITCVQTLLDTPDQMGVYARLKRKGKLPIRVVGMPPYDSIAELHAHGINTTFGDEMLRFGAAKIFSDGSLGARTALLADPYSDDPTTHGIRIHDPQRLKEMARDAQDKGFQLAIHAIGDQAVRECIDAIEFALQGESNAQHRHRIEHASMCPPDCLERMAKLEIVAVVQPQFVVSDTWTPDRIGTERSRHAYNFRSLLRSGVPLALSSDCPVERLDSSLCLNAATTPSAWSPEESLSPDQAIRAYCTGSAYAAHLEDRLGALKVGASADFVMLAEGATSKVERTFVAGIEHR